MSYLRLGYTQDKKLGGYVGFLAYRKNRHGKDVWRIYQKVTRNCIISALQDAAFERKEYMERNGLDKQYPNDYRIAEFAHIDILSL